MDSLVTAASTTERLATLDARVNAHDVNFADVARVFRADQAAIASTTRLAHAHEAKIILLEKRVTELTGILHTVSQTCVALQASAIQSEQRLAASHAEVQRLLQRVASLLKVHQEQEQLAAAAGY